MVHTCGLTLSPVKSASRELLDTLKHQCDCAPVSMGEYVASPRVAADLVRVFSETDSLLAARLEYAAMDVQLTEAEAVGHADTATGSVIGSMFTLTNTILGSGTLAVPFAIASSGWVLGNVIMLAIALLTQYSVHLLLSASDRAGVQCAKTYESLGHFTMGSFGSHLAEFTFIFGGFGTLVSYFVFITDLAAAVLGVDAAHKWLLTVGTVGLVVLPLSLSRRLGKLRLASVLAILAIGYVVSFVLVAYLATNYRATTEVSTPSGFQAVKFEPGSVYTVTLLIAAFACHNTALPVYEELRSRSLPRMNRAVIGAIATAFLLYETVAICGYLQFGDATRDNILLNFSPEYVEKHPSIAFPLLLGQLCMALALLLTAPIAMWPFRSCILSVYLRLKTGVQTPSHDATHTEYVGVTVASQTLILLCSIFVPSVKIPLSIVGSVSGSLLIFIMPALFFLLQSPGPLLARNHIGPLLMLIAGVIVGVLGLSLTLYKIAHEHF
ncbi:hypothetical protein BBJ28_00025569 [Nothophytophthora sp. Chile5]|nr:hypothetical protein BBJ28_00025569 [Nothophytophthora sp. Chile5]